MSKYVFIFVRHSKLVTLLSKPFSKYYEERRVVQGV